MSQPREVKTEDIVAFLDDELKGQSRSSVEASISLDPAVRAEADQLKRTWDLLDYLPRGEASETFTERTLERLAPSGIRQEERSTGVQAAPKPVRSGRLLFVLGTLTLAVAAGFLAYELAEPGSRVSKLERDLGTLPVGDVRSIGRLPWYQHISDLEYLQSLARSDWFEDLDPEPLPSGDGPEGLEYLAARLAEFRALPKKRQAQIRELDRELFELPDDQRERLTHVMAAYAGWLNALPAADREKLEGMPASERSTAVARLREREWSASLSAGRRAEMKATPPDHVPELIANSREEDIQWHAEWRWAGSHWAELRHVRSALPLASRTFRDELDQYVESRLPRLAAGELKELSDARELRRTGDYPGYVAAIGDLAERHPELPGPENGPRRYDELPEAVRDAMSQAGFGPVIKEAVPYEGTWPEYAAAVSLAARKGGIKFPAELGPARPGDFDEPTRAFIRQLSGMLTKAEQRSLAQAEGLWPEYPRALIEYSRRHGISPPVPGLPGPAEAWGRGRRWK